jgi:hypothetical protein
MLLLKASNANLSGQPDSLALRIAEPLVSSR